MRRYRRWVPFTLAGLALLWIATIPGCASPPKNPQNGCDIFMEKRSWYRDALKSQKKWGVPINVQLAIIYQESRFDHDAKPPRDRILWVIPWFRSSSAYGYGQAQDDTWKWYIRSTGNRGADRDDFGDVADFIGWYGDVSHRKLGISKHDAYRQYLAYHEGHGGYRRKTWARKKWLTRVARKVERRSNAYKAQLARCEAKLDRGWHLWPF